MRRLLALAPIVLLCLPTLQSRGGDWPQFRYDAGRTAASPHELPGDLQLRWKRDLPTPRPAFPHELRLAYDASYEPVVLGKTIFVPSMVTDSVTAFETDTGDERWRFFADGPVRFAPVAWKDRLYFVSDDGYLYCLNAEDGSLLWKFRGLPADRQDRKVLGNGRLISLWPARGGAVLQDGVVYFAAGLWPTEGVFVHAVDARTGAAVWSNVDGNHIPSSNWDHGIGQFSGLTPQGYLAVADDRLVLPCGAQLPAFLDRKTGELQQYTMGWGGRLGLPKGCWFVACVGRYLSHGGDLYDITRPSDEHLAKNNPNRPDYKPMLYPGGWTRLDIERANQRELDRFRQPVLTPDVMFESDRSIVARDLTEYTLHRWTPENTPAHRANDEVPDRLGAEFRQVWELPSELDVHIMAGSRLYVGGPGVVEAIETTCEPPAVAWHADIDGTPNRLLAADDKLFVVTTKGSILAFSAPQDAKALSHPLNTTPPSTPDRWTAKAKAILDATDVHDGYALVLGLNSGRLIEELVGQSSLHVIAVDKDANKVAEIRRRLVERGWYGARTSVVVGDPLTYPFSPFMASLVVTESPDAFASAEDLSLARSVYHTLRPYGGVACAWGEQADLGRVEEILQGEGFPGATVRQVNEFVLMARSGSLPGGADWSHQEANAACTGASMDQVQAPTSVLWFDASRRWHKFPGQVQVRVADGRVVLYEEGLLQAFDVFTGRLIWEVELSADPPDRASIRYARHREWGPRPSLSAAVQLVALQDEIYLSEGKTCRVFAASTGQMVRQIQLPEGLSTPWANLRIEEDYLLGSSGKHLLCMNRKTCEMVWRFEAERTPLYLAVGSGKVFCSELANPQRGESEGRIVAIDLASGAKIWERKGGARLRYSKTLDMLVTTGGFYQASSGEPVSDSPNVPLAELLVTGGGLPKTGVPGYIAGNRLLAGADDVLRVYDLPSGERLGTPLQWSRRGCTGTRASTNLVTTRLKGNSAWIDLDSRKITPVLGIRPACSTNNNLYPADGVLNIPSLTAGCTCNYAPVSMACVPPDLIERDGAE